MSNVLEFPKKESDLKKEKGNQVSANHRAAYKEMEAVADKYGIPAFMVSFSHKDRESSFSVDTTEFHTNPSLTASEAFTYQVDLLIRSGEIYETTLLESPYADIIQEEVNKRVVELQIKIHEEDK